MFLATRKFSKKSSYLFAASLLVDCPFVGDTTRRWALGLMFGWVALLFSPAQGWAIDLHVAANAQPGGNGSQAKPFKSLTEARDRIRAARKSGQLKPDQAVNVLVGPGTYRIEHSFKLTAEDSGSAAAPVVYRAIQPGTALISGGLTIPSDSFVAVSDPEIRERLDESVRDKVRVADLTSMFPKEISQWKTSFRGTPGGPWLYVDEQPMTLARWPNLDAENEGWADFSKAIDSGLADPDSEDPARRKARPGAFEFRDPRPTRWNLDEGVWLLGFWTHDWSDEVIRIGAYDAEKQVIRLAAPHNYGIMAGTWGGSKRRFFAFNVLEELDAPGEWYLDRKGRQLYYYPAETASSSSIVLATLPQSLVRMENAHHIKIEGLRFEYGIADGISLKETTAVEFAGCTVANVSRGGISINGTENTIRSCDLYNLGTAGISVRGGDRKTLTPAKNLVVNSHIHDYGKFQRSYAAGISVKGCGQIVRNNLIHDAPHNAILYGGNEHLMERNEIYRVVMETGDSGAFYTGRDWTSQGNVLRHNYIHDLGGGDSKHVNTMGVYLDDCDSGDTIEGNVFVRAGRAIMIGGGRDNRVVNNLVIDCPIGLHLDSRGMTWKQWNNPKYAGWNLEEKAEAMNYRNPPWSDRYPSLAVIMDDSPRQPLHNAILRNVFVDCSKQVGSFSGGVMKLLDKLDIADNLAVNTTGAAKGIASTKDIQGFTNIAGSTENPVQVGGSELSDGSFTRLKDARLTEALSSFEEIPFDKIGLFQDNYRHTLPVK
ncbi:right-handed parallel beta-helix repeat-containing protein [Rosistilla ulvae]|nr:right-handed parallel beta-helix repeat-containing protein [Rosistilla ulvae]